MNIARYIHKSIDCILIKVPDQSWEQGVGEYIQNSATLMEL